MGWEGKSGKKESEKLWVSWRERGVVAVIKGVSAVQRERMSEGAKRDRLVHLNIALIVLMYSFATHCAKPTNHTHIPTSFSPFLKP